MVAAKYDINVQSYLTFYSIIMDSILSFQNFIIFGGRGSGS